MGWVGNRVKETMRGVKLPILCSNARNPYKTFVLVEQIDSNIHMYYIFLGHSATLPNSPVLCCPLKGTKTLLNCL